MTATRTTTANAIIGARRSHPRLETEIETEAGSGTVTGIEIVTETTVAVETVVAVVNSNLLNPKFPFHQSSKTITLILKTL